jgi:hypothetical protein
MTFPVLHTVPLTRVAPPPRHEPPAADPAPAPFRVLNGAVYFNGNCEACRPFCASVCCRGYAYVALTEEEAKSGRYVYKEADDSCGCDLCGAMREAGLRYVVRKRADGACVHLDGTGRCSVYEHRPETCRGYTCASIGFRITP